MKVLIIDKHLYTKSPGKFEKQTNSISKTPQKSKYSNVEIKNVQWKIMRHPDTFALMDTKDLSAISAREQIEEQATIKYLRSQIPLKNRVTAKAKPSLKSQRRTTQ